MTYCNAKDHRNIRIYYMDGTRVPNVTEARDRHVQPGHPCNGVRERRIRELKVLDNKYSALQAKARGKLGPATRHVQHEGQDGNKERYRSVKQYTTVSTTELAHGLLLLSRMV